MLINWIRPNKSESDLFLSTRNLQNERFKSVFKYKITLWICVIALGIHKGFSSQKVEMFVLKLSDIQKIISMYLYDAK